MWRPCLPISFLFFTGTCSTFLGMCASIQLSLFGLLVMSSRHLCDISWSGVLLMILLFWEILILILIGKYHVLFMYYDETIHNWRLRWLPSSVVCGIFFKDINSCSVIWSPSMNSAGRPHFHVPCPACVLFWLSRSGTATLFVNVFTQFTIVNIAAEEPSVEQAKLVLHTSCTNDWLRAVRACLSHSACWCLNVPLVSNLSRMSCNLCVNLPECARITPAKFYLIGQRFLSVWSANLHHPSNLTSMLGEFTYKSH